MGKLGDGKFVPSIDDGDGSIMEAELIKERHQSSEQLKVHMQMLWNQYDFNGNGKLEVRELKHLLKESIVVMERSWKRRRDAELGKGSTGNAKLVAAATLHVED